MEEERMLTENEQLHVDYNNAVADAEFYKDKLDIATRKSVGYRVGSYINKMIRKTRKLLQNIRSWKFFREAMKLNRNGLNTEEVREKRIIVSLTSYPARINKVPATIGSLLRQTVKPDKIVLWLGIEKFPEKRLPEIYDEIRRCGVDIEFRQDLKSHTKYFYAIQEFSEDIIITVDDDLIYHNTMVEELYKSYVKYPNCISALRVHKMRFASDGSLMPYMSWIYEYNSEIGSKSHRYFATGTGGVLYPPHSLHKEATNLMVIKERCHNHDDLWLKVMEVMNGTKVVIAADSKLASSKDILINDTQRTGQWHENVVEGGNEVQTASVLDYYSSWKKEDKGILEIMQID